MSRTTLLIIATLLVAPTVLLIIGVIVATLIGKRRRLQCPACLQRGLKQMSVVRAPMTMNGQDTFDYRAYFRCQFCGTRFKRHDGILAGVPDDELADASRFG